MFSLLISSPSSVKTRRNILHAVDALSPYKNYLLVAIFSQCINIQTTYLARSNVLNIEQLELPFNTEFSQWENTTF